MRIGFIGLGIMGKPMAMNLLKAGHELWVNNRTESKSKELEAYGAKAVTKEELARNCDLILTMLPNGPEVKEVVLGENGIAQFMRPGTVLIDMSSINPMTSKEIAEELAKKDIEMLDAPVSGGEPKAIDGTLSFMVGGKEQVFQQYKPVLLVMGASAVLCGDIGAGNTTKLANQIIVALNITACSEAFTLAKMAGMDPEKVFQAIRGGLAGSTVMEAKVPKMIENNFTPGFKIDLHRKDLNNVIECAQTIGAPIPMTVQVQEILHNLHRRGFGQDDHSGIANYYAMLSGTAIGEDTIN